MPSRRVLEVRLDAYIQKEDGTRDYSHQENLSRQTFANTDEGERYQAELQSRAFPAMAEVWAKECNEYKDRKLGKGSK